MTDDEIYHTAQSLASDLAEDEMQADIASMYIEHSREKARAIRARSEAQRAWSGGALTPEDRYHAIQWSVYGALHTLLRGYKGWKLVREP